MITIYSNSFLDEEIYVQKYRNIIKNYFVDCTIRYVLTSGTSTKVHGYFRIRIKDNLKYYAKDMLKIIIPELAWS